MQSPAGFGLLCTQTAPFLPGSVHHLMALPQARAYGVAIAALRAKRVLIPKN